MNKLPHSSATRHYSSSPLLALALAFGVIGCSTTAPYPVNPPIDGRDPSKEYRFRNHGHDETSDSLGVMLTFSAQRLAIIGILDSNAGGMD